MKGTFSSMYRHAHSLYPPDVANAIVNAVLKQRNRLIRVEALETNSGIRAGDRVEVLPYRSSGGKHVPRFSGAVDRIEYLSGFDLAYYRITAVDETGGRFEGAEHYFIKIGEQNET